MQLLHAKVTQVYLSVGDHADTDDDEDEETGGMFDPHHTRHTPAAHTHTRAGNEPSRRYGYQQSWRRPLLVDST